MSYWHRGGSTREIRLDGTQGKKGEAAFRNELKRFTTGSKPHHCLVQTIEITTPSNLLDEGVVLIDTPGLDDTERFRVNLTEEAVQAVDAILFLTQSGVAYGQSEKDFLLTLLRKGTVKQLVFVITQVDKTYAQHVRQARDEGESPESVDKRVDIERRRLEQQIEATLLELSDGSDSPALQRYREQLGDVEVVFTSAANHRDWLAKEDVKHPLRPNDPGGLLAVKDSLLELLSTESRLAATARAIEAGAGALLDTMLRVVENRRIAVHSIKNREEAERQLGAFRLQLEKACEQFGATTGQDTSTLRAGLAAKNRVAQVLMENIVLQADLVLGRYETDDAARHWKTRRVGRWGHMHALQAQVANVIFPRVASLLTEQQAEFEAFIEKFKVHLLTLSEASISVAESLELGSEVRLDVRERLSEFLASVLVNLQGLIISEEEQIVALLDGFVDDEVAERIAAAREAVSDEWGSGTTYRQTQRVKGFYVEMKRILRQALEKHLTTAYDGFVGYLQAEADALPGKAMGEVTAELERVQANITAAAEAAVQGKKAAFDELADGLATPLREAVEAIRAKLGGLSGSAVGAGLIEPTTDPDASALPAEPSAPTPTDELRPSKVDSRKPLDDELVLATAPSLEFFAAVKRTATQLRARFTLVKGSGGWPLARIYGDRFIADAKHVLLVDPHLFLSHQMRNLEEFIARMRKGGTLKTVKVVTGDPKGMETAEQDSKLRELARQLDGLGVNLSWDVNPDIHDRFVVVDSGHVFKLGRGLDIYQTPKGLAKGTQELRTVRDCEIDVFGPAGSD